MREAPGVAERIDDLGIARAPERVPWRHGDFRAGVFRALDRLVAILDFEMHGHRGAAEQIGRADMALALMLGAIFGKVVHDENPSRR